MSTSKTPYLQLIIPRVAKTVARLEQKIWKQASKPTPVSTLPSTAKHQNYADVTWSHLQAIKAYPHHWGRIYEQAWYRIHLTAEELGDCRYLFWKDQAEATLYVDGQPWSGFDVAHRYAPLPTEFKELTVEAICCQSAIWHPDATGIDDSGSRFEGAFLAERNETAWKTYHDFKVLFDLALYIAERDGEDPKDLVKIERYRKPLDRMAPQARRIFMELDRVVDRFELDGIEAISEQVAKLLKSMQAVSTSMQVTLTGHAHIDLVWLWPENVGEAKAVHTFATANRLMEQYPEFHFGYSQPASYEAVARRSPELMASVAKQIKGGRWEPTGAMYVESDTQLACGEALLRSFTLGQEGFRKLTGAPSKVVWLPDVFGYTGCLPQLMKETGAEYFFTTKQAWSNSTRFPFSSFRWRGNDGTEVVAHVLHSLLSNCYNTTTAVDEIVEPTLSHQQSGIHPEALIPVGYGDGGGGPTEEMCERARRMQTLDGMPPTQWGRIEQFFERMNPIREELPIWHGEIYLEFHRGVQTTQAKLKQNFRALERALQTLEAAHALTGKGPIPEAYWKRMVFAQFHDYIPGSSVHEVYDQALPELETLAHELNQATLQTLGAGNDGLFNPLPYTVEHVFDDGVTAQQISLAPLSQTLLSEATPCQDTIQATGTSLSNERVQAKFNESGEITGLIIDGEATPTDGPLNQLFTFPDHPVTFDAWDIDRQSVANPAKPLSCREKPSIKRTPSEASVSFEIQLTQKSNTTVHYSLGLKDAYLRIRYDINWQDKKTLLQAHFPTKYFGRTARYGAPFGSTTRPQLANDPAADAQFEVPASRWAIVSDDNERDGLAVISKDRYGFGCRDGDLHVSLVRSAMITAGNNNKNLRKRDYPHDVSDLGTHRFEIALARGNIDAPRHEQAAALADIIFTNPIPTAVSKTYCAGICSIEGGDTLIPAWIKPANDNKGHILRLHETRGYRGTIKLQLAEAWSASETTCLEETDQPLVEGQIAFTPYSIHSIRIKRDISS
jgi:alpha-mannosidase